MKTPPLLLLLASIVYAGAAHSQASSSPRSEDTHLFNPRIVPFEPYEPSYIGYTRDNDDVGFMDFKISLKYPVFREGLCGISPHSRLYFVFTGRWGQYITTRDSSPVIAKRFNPKMAWRQTLNYVDDKRKASDAPPPTEKTSCYQEVGKLPGTYLEVAFGHESNGQTIRSPEQLLQDEGRERSVGGRDAFARDHISRGWDVFEVTARHPWRWDNDDLVNLYAIAKYFLPNGPFQGRKEEFNPWETDPEGKPRSHVNGLGAIVKWQREWGWWAFSNPKVAAVFETGYARPFRYNTYRVEAGVRVFQLPITVWGQRGYGSDLAQYYKKVNSWGVELEIGSF